jgi:hypothetical protein
MEQCSHRSREKDDPSIDAIVEASQPELVDCESKMPLRGLGLNDGEFSLPSAQGPPSVSNPVPTRLLAEDIGRRHIARHGLASEQDRDPIHAFTRSSVAREHQVSSDEPVAMNDLKAVSRLTLPTALQLSRQRIGTV